MSDNERAQVIGPSMNKIRSFTTRTALRLMLGQSRGFRLSEVFTRRRILVVPLAAGTLGSETTALLGSLLMAGLWSATQARVSIAAERRHPVFVYLDEFQMFMRLDMELAPLTVEDLTGLHAYEIALRASVNGVTLPPATGRTVPLGPATTDGRVLADLSRERYGMPRTEVEAALAARIEVGKRQATFGWEARPGGQP